MTCGQSQVPQYYKDGTVRIASLHPRANPLVSPGQLSSIGCSGRMKFYCKVSMKCPVHLHDMDGSMLCPSILALFMGGGVGNKTSGHGITTAAPPLTS